MPLSARERAPDVILPWLMHLMHDGAPLGALTRALGASAEDVLADQVRKQPDRHGTSLQRCLPSSANIRLPVTPTGSSTPSSSTSPSASTLMRNTDPATGPRRARAARPDVWPCLVGHHREPRTIGGGQGRAGTYSGAIGSVLAKPYRPRIRFCAVVSARDGIAAELPVAREDVIAIRLKGRPR